MNETITPRKFEDRFPVANIGYRILAFLIDFIIYWLIGFVIALFLGAEHEHGVGFTLTGWPALGLFFFGFVLWPISEGLTGQTIGKRILNLKVVTTRRREIGVGQAFGRFFLGFVDYFFLIGIIVALTDKENKRIGDMAAGTIVVSTMKNK